MGYDVRDNGNGYDRGKAAGEISARLAEHDRTLIEIKTTLREVMDGQHRLALQIQHLTDLHSEETDDTRRHMAWRMSFFSGWAALAALIGAVAALIVMFI